MFLFQIFVQAIDSLNPANGIAYTTIEVRLNNLFDVFPYINRERTSGRIYLTLSERTSLNASVFDLKPLLVQPPGVELSRLYFYVFETGRQRVRRSLYWHEYSLTLLVPLTANPYSLSDQFYVNPMRQTTLQLTRPLNAKVKDQYQIFVYVSLTPLNSTCCGYGQTPDPNNTALIFFDINVSVCNKNKPYFIDATEIMCKCTMESRRSGS